MKPDLIKIIEAKKQKIRIFKQKEIMAVQTFSIDLPSDILLTINETEKELKSRIKLSLAIYLYLQEKITIGKAAQNRRTVTIFSLKQKILSESKIPVSNLGIEDIIE
ncbi:MAG: UPF0175 family protein [Bacteroidia bacterium]